MFDTIHRNKTHYQKRAYQCIKCLVSLFTTCPTAAQILQSNVDLRRKWANAVSWLNDELERRPYMSNAQYGYNNWSPPAQSNESSNGYYLERSHSARITLAKAFELCPEEERGDEQEEQEMSEDTDSPPPESNLDNSLDTLDWNTFGSTNVFAPNTSQQPQSNPPSPTQETQGEETSDYQNPWINISTATAKKKSTVVPVTVTSRVLSPITQQPQSTSQPENNGDTENNKLIKMLR